jgi:hypothetical protein
VLRRLEFHYVPKHASWLNMVEIEISVLRSQCLDRRIATPEQLVSEIAAWERQRNASGARIKWMFTTAKARAKMGRAQRARPALQFWSASDTVAAQMRHPAFLQPPPLRKPSRPVSGLSCDHVGC